MLFAKLWWRDYALWGLRHEDGGRIESNICNHQSANLNPNRREREGIRAFGRQAPGRKVGMQECQELLDKLQGYFKQNYS